ncbi:sensor domain-containing diguanylate cyclase [Ectothiorhodospira mobilis]|uniref:sensor domain-containing diguanylate cyclase n=1 Tax=Ectothiorhodospira mobilis TaxID=195064 RepID=UPI0019032EB9|nr:diguanylate cyclase [Ectothiorhodospira mobilis]MBK1692114.1 sensor domain-containing diguanylate cyclase [Ectothiorhodospira mobilis]
MSPDHPTSSPPSPPGLPLPRLLEAAVEQSFNAVVITTADLEPPGPRIVYVNPAFVRMTGYPAEELYGRNPRLLQGPRTQPETIQRLRECLREGRYFQGSTVNYRKDGTSYYVEWNISPVRDENGQVAYFVSVQRDISEQVAAEDRYDLMASALEVNSDQVVMTDREGRIVYVNAAFEERTGYRREEVLGENPRLLQSGHHDQEFYRELWSTVKGGAPFRATFVNRARDGTLFHLEQTITPVRNRLKEITHFLSIGKDISERVHMEQALRRMATMDLLTGLPNRSFGEQILEREWNRACRYGEIFSVIMADIDHFKAINDHYGHGVGDQILTRVGQQLRKLTRDSDFAIRWGGEEFLILVPKADAKAACGLAERIRAGVAGETHDPVGRITLSLGVAGYRGGDSRKRLLRRADDALYRAKENGRNRIECA